jgi:Tetracyclin repressor-like, C-terminal domain
MCRIASFGRRPRGDSSGSDVLVSKRDRYQQLIHNAVTAGIRTERVFRDVDPDTATLAVFGIGNWAHHWWRPGGTAHPGHTAQKMWDLIIRGLTGPAEQSGQPRGSFRHRPAMDLGHTWR